MVIKKRSEVIIRIKISYLERSEVVIFANVFGIVQR
jgi:hypothetical protein